MKLSRVVVGVDFRPPSIEAARWTALHVAPDAGIVLVHAIDAPEPPGALEGWFPPREERIETMRAGARRRLEALGRWTCDPRVVIDVRVGAAGTALVEAADIHGADVLVIGEHGERPALWDLLGTTAERAIGESAVPVLVARGLPEKAPQRILAAVSRGGHADRELEWARFLGARFGAHVSILSVVSPSVVPSVEMAGVAALGDLAFSRAAAERWVAGRAAGAGFGGGEAELEVVVGDPAEEILDAAARTAADLVVIGSHGAGGLVGGIAAGVAHAVLRRGDVPVFVIGPLAS